MSFFGLFGKKPFAERVGLPDSVAKDLVEWATTGDDKEACRFLETHLGLIRRESLAAMDLIIEEFSKSSKHLIYAEDAQRKRQILAAVQARGATREAVRSVYQQYMGI